MGGRRRGHAHSRSTCRLHCKDHTLHGHKPLERKTTLMSDCAAPSSCSSLAFSARSCPSLLPSRPYPYPQARRVVRNCRSSLLCSAWSAGLRCQSRTFCRVLCAAVWAFRSHLLWRALRAGRRVRPRPQHRSLRRPHRHPARLCVLHGMLENVSIS